MKKLLLFLLLFSSLYAQSTFYVGTNYGIFNETFSELDATSSSSMATLKVGYGDIKAYAIEFSVEYADNQSKIFSSNPAIEKDGDKYGFNISLLKSFDFNYLLPYIKVGFGTGYLDIDRSLQDSLTYGSFQLSLGSYIPLDDSFDLEIGYEIRHTSYEAINTIVTKTSYNSVNNIGYIGINYRY